MKKHPLEIIANDWTSQSELYFNDLEVSTQFYLLNYKYHFTPIKEWTTPSLIKCSKEFAKGNFGFESSFIGIEAFHELFSENSFPKDLPEKIIFTLPKNKKLTDFISAGFLSNYGFLVSEKALNIILKFNIGNYKTYNVDVIHKDELYYNYYLFVFKNDLSNYIDFKTSQFFYQEEYLDFESRKPLSINSEEDYMQFSETEREYIHAKSFSLKGNLKPDLFSIDKFIFGDTFISKNLIEELSVCSGLKIEETKRM
ncbi:MAG: hypothetical protein RLZZ175_790 [Bacteroidota bacterium]|jgi:hypothetical protein